VLRQDDTIDLGSACSPVVIKDNVFRFSNGTTHHVPFWSKPNSSFGFLSLMAFNSDSHILTLSISLAPHPHTASRIQKHDLHRGSTVKTGDTLSGCFTPDGYPSRATPRLLLVVQQAH